MPPLHVRRLIAPLCAAAALLTLACSDGTAPAPLLFRYDLVSVGDETLPATLYGPQRFTTNDGIDVTCEDRLHSRRLELGRAHRYTVNSASLLVCDDGRPNVETHVTSEGTYTLSGSSLTLTSDPSRFDGSISVWQGARSGLELQLWQPRTGSGYGDYIGDPRPYLYRAAR